MQELVKTIGYGSPVSEPEAATEARGDRGRRARPRSLRGGGARARRSGLPGRPAARRVTRRGRGLGAGDVREGIPELALVHPGHEPRAWLLRILTNLNIDRGRRIQRAPDTQPLEEGDYYLANKVAEAQGEQALDQERVVERLSQDSIVNALSSLQHDFRDVVVLVDIGDFSYADAAQILDIPIGTVMSRLHRGRRQLKSALAEEATA